MARPRRPPAASAATADPAGPAAIVERTLNQTAPGRQEHDLRRRRFDAAYDAWRGNTGMSTRFRGTSGSPGCA